jgi:hypothetical protein
MLVFLPTFVSCPFLLGLLDVKLDVYFVIYVYGR